MKLISETIEKFEYAFENPKLPYQCQVFELILEKCGKLQELVINCARLIHLMMLNLQDVYSGLPVCVQLILLLLIC